MTITRKTCCIALTVSALATAQSQRPNKPSAQSLLAMEPYQKAFFAVADEIWEFAPMPDGANGLLVRIKTKDREERFTISHGVLGRVLGIVAVRNGQIAALGVACLSQDEEQIYYRMLVSGGPRRSENGWASSDPVATRHISQRFDFMSIAVTHGDSTLLVLQSLIRGQDHDTVESEYFLHHCPPNGGEYVKGWINGIKHTRTVASIEQ